MLNKQLQIFRSAQRELSKFAAMGSPVQVGPFMRGCLKYRKRSEKPFVFFDSSDDEPEEINKSGKTVKSQSDALGENNRNVNSARKRRTQSVIHNTSDSDFETEPKKPKLSKQQKNPEKSGLDIKNEEILDDDVLYAGETQPFFEDDINEQLDDSLLNDSPVQIVSVESDQETDDGQDADGQSGQPSGHIDSQNLDKSTENSEDKSSNDLKLKSDNFVDDDAVLDDVIESILEDDKEPHQNENEPKKHFQDGNDSDVSSGSGPIVIREKRPDNSQGFFARKRRADTGASTSRGLRSRPREQSPEIPLKSQRSESPSSKLTNFDIDKNGIACPLCNVLFHPDMILRHASECNGPVEEETTNKETEPIEITEVLNSEDDNSTGSQMEHDHTGGWVFSEAVTTPVAKYGSKKKTIFKPAEEGDVYRISSSSDEDILPSRRTSHDNISSGPDHIDQVVSDMVGRKQMSISVPKATKRQRTKQQSKNRVKEEAMETCFMCKKLVPKSEYPEHVNAELEKQNMEESLHVESQQPSTSIGERVRKTAKRNTRKKEKIEDDEEKEEGDLDDLIAFSHKKTQEDDGDYDVEDDVEIDEYSDNEDTPTGGEFDVSDSPIKAFRNIKNMPSGFIDYNNQFNNKPKRGGQVNEKSYFPTTSKPQSRGRRKRGGRGRGGGRFRKKK
ncbi:uncharacterized protein [Antedon mediterranea]|uniref:uncharacterized protein n=1 Tax=Antedon mediterranea TaxID=105859 RepID=UPI003AF9D9AA